MTDVKALRATIKDRGMTVSAVARKANIQRETLYNRFNDGDFKLSQVEALTKALSLNKRERNRIFFANNS